MKPPVLSDEELRGVHDYWRDLSGSAVARVRNIAQAQRDADVEYYEKQQDEMADAMAQGIRQARQDTAKEIFEEIAEKHWHQGSNNVWYVYMSDADWQSLKEEYFGKNTNND